MRILPYLFFLFSSPSLAAPSPMLEIQVKLHYSTQFTKIFSGKDGWYCATEHNPMFPLVAKPKFLELFREKKEKPQKGCRDTFQASLNLENKKSKIWSGCTKESDAADFLKAVGHECGRF